MDRNIGLEMVRITESAAISSARWVGRGDKHAADKAATEMMRKNFNNLNISGRIVIGEGERDKAPMLFIGEEVGAGGVELDIAVDPLECTNSVAFGRPNAISVIAAAPKGTMLHAPDVYMEKIAVGPEAAGKVNLDWPVQKNLEAVAKAKNMQVKDLRVIMMDRDYNAKLLEDVRKAGARVMLIADGDVAGAVATCLKSSDIDILLGSGAAPEGVIGCAAVKSFKGQFEGRLRFDIGKLKGQDGEMARKKAIEMGVKDPDARMTQDEIIKSDRCIFAATGILAGPMVKGVDFTPEGAITRSIVIRQKSGTLRYLETHHIFEDEPDY